MDEPKLAVDVEKQFLDYNQDIVYNDKSIVPVENEDSQDEDVQVDPYGLLTDIEVRAISCFKEGMSNKVIAEDLGCDIRVVRSLFKRKHVVSVIADCIEEWAVDLKSLDGLVVDVLKKNLKSEEDATALKAADMILKARGKYTKALNDGDQEEKATAEDIMRKLIGINININNSPA